MRGLCCLAFACATLGASLAQAGHFDPPKCHSVKECVGLAEQSPEKFSPELKDGLESLTGAQLMEGLAFVHPKPAVNKLVRQGVLAALCHEGGHTAKSAAELLDLAIATGEVWYRGCWLGLLSQDAAGQPTLQKFIDRDPSGPIQRAAMMYYLSGVGRMTQVERMAAIKAGSSWEVFEKFAVPAAKQPVVDRYVEIIWKRYVASRARPGASPRELSAIQVHLQGTKYMDGFAAFVRADVAAGRLPVREDMALLGAFAVRSQPILREILGWAASGTPALRRAVLEDGNLLLGLGLADIDPSTRSRALPKEKEDRVQYRRVLMAAALDPDQPDRESVPSFLISYLDDLSLEEARTIAGIARDHEEQGGRKGDDDLLMAVADQFEEFRPPILKRLLGDDLEDASRVAIGQHAWIREAARNWLEGLREDDLRDEPTQERFIVLLRAMQRERERWSVALPETRRPHEEAGQYHCYSGPMMAYQAAQQERQELEAFGKPLPAKTPEEQVPNAGRPGHFERHEVPAAPVMTPQQATVRWQHFVLARKWLLQKMKATPSADENTDPAAGQRR